MPVKVKDIQCTTPVKSRCFVVGGRTRMYRSGGCDGVSIPTHNSVLQRNFVFQAIMRPKHWRFIGVDLKKVELSVYRPYLPVVLGIATILEDALTVLRFAQQTMMQRYSLMEDEQVNNYKDLPEPDEGSYQRLMVMVDEAAELLSPSGVKTDEGKADDLLKGEALTLIGSIARLGRAAGVHLVLAMQRPDAKIISGEIRSNFMCRIAAGRLTAAASGMTLESGEGTLIPAHIKGRGKAYLNGSIVDFQGFYAAPEYIDEWRAANPVLAGLEEELIDIETEDGQTTVYTDELDENGNRRTLTFGQKADEDADDTVMSTWGEDMEVISEHGSRGRTMI